MSANFHRFLRLDSTPPPVESVSALAAAILNRFSGIPRSVTGYRRMGPLSIRWNDENGPTVTKIQFAQLVEGMRATRSFPNEQFRLPKPLSDWLDSSVWVIKPDAPIPAADGTHTLAFAVPTSFGNAFELVPAIDREGVGMSSLQLHVQKEIVRLFHDLVEGMENPVSGESNWLSQFRMLLNECISVVDMTLHQTYFMAKHRGREFGWSFDEVSLGERHGRRLDDKLNWIGKITGRPLDDAQRELKDFGILRELRNHLNHFDPPCFAFHLEEVVGWLNLTPSVGKLLWKVRSKLETQLSIGIVEIVLLPHVQFVPKDPAAPRPPANEKAGYPSTQF
jgi:hypothetical protein